MRLLAALVFVALAILMPAAAQFDGVMVPVRKASVTLAAPISFSPSSVSVADNCCSAAGTTLATIAVSMSDGSTFAGQCYDTDPNGLTQILPSSGGCTLQSKIAYSSANDGTYSNITLNFCNGGVNCLNPSATNFTLVINSSGIPAAANAGCLVSNGGGPTNGSCFNTLALDMEFGNPAAVSGFSNGTKFNAQNAANWLLCSSQTPTNLVADVIIAQGSAGGFGSLAPCSAASIVTDGANGSVLQMLIQPGDPENSTGVSSFTLEFEDGRFGVGHPIPAQFYAEMTYRVPLTNYNPSAHMVGDFWSYTGGTAPPCFEADFTEFAATSSGAGTNYCPNTNTLENHGWNTTDIPGYTQQSYETVGERITYSGSDAIVCWYYNEVQYQLIAPGWFPINNCADIYYSGSPITYQTAMALLLQVGQEGGGSPQTDNILYYVKSIKLFTCQNWVNATSGTGNGVGTGAQCQGVALASNP